MSAATIALPQTARRRRLAVVLLATAIAGGIGAALPSTDAQAYPISDPWCQTQGEQVDCAVR
jgi:hypothetical protein